MKYSSTILFIVLCTSKMAAQKVDQFNSWWYYRATYKMASKTDINVLYAWSRHDFVRDWQLSKLRIGGRYHQFSNLSWGGGYEWVVLFPYGEHPVKSKRTEHRMYQEIELKMKVEAVGIKIALLQEQRYLSSGLRHRSSFKLAGRFPLLNVGDHEPKFHFSFSNQLFLHVGRQVAAHFAQNRAFVGIDFPLIQNLRITIGYLNQYLFIRSHIIENNHTLMFGLLHRFAITE